jgi:hypothetical protein
LVYPNLFNTLYGPFKGLATALELMCVARVWTLAERSVVKKRKTKKVFSYISFKENKRKEIILLI